MTKTKTFASAFPFPLGPEGLQEVGKYIVAWNLVEQEMEDLLSRVTAVGWHALNVLMKNPNIVARMDIFTALFDDAIPDKELRREALTCANAVKEMSNFRNEIAHGRWRAVRGEWDDEGHRPMMYKASKQLMAPKTIDEQDVAPQLEKLCGLFVRIIDLVDKCLAYIKAGGEVSCRRLTSKAT